MKREIHLVARLAVCGLLFSCAAFSGTTYASAAEHSFVSRTAEIDASTALHDRGHGPSVILLHGYAETSRMWTPYCRCLEKSLRSSLPICRDRRFGYSEGWSGHEDRGDPHSCARALAWSGESQSRRTRHRSDGGLRLPPPQFPAEVESSW